MAKWKPPGDRLLNQCKRTIQNQINFKRRLEDLVSSNEALRKARIEAAVALKKQTQQTADAEIKLSQIEAKLLEKDMALLAAIERADVAERKQVVANVSTQTTLLRIPEKSKSEHPTLASKIEIPLKTVKVLSVAEEFGARRPTKRSLAAIRIELQIPDIDPQPSKGIDSRMKKKARLEADATLPDKIRKSPTRVKVEPKEFVAPGPGTPVVEKKSAPKSNVASFPLKCGNASSSSSKRDHSPSPAKEPRSIQPSTPIKYELSEVNPTPSHSDDVAWIDVVRTRFPFFTSSKVSSEAARQFLSPLQEFKSVVPHGGSKFAARIVPASLRDDFLEHMIESGTIPFVYPSKSSFIDEKLESVNQRARKRKRSDDLESSSLPASPSPKPSPAAASTGILTVHKDSPRPPSISVKKEVFKCAGYGCKFSHLEEWQVKKHTKLFHENVEVVFRDSQAVKTLMERNEEGLLCCPCLYSTASSAKMTAHAKECLGKASNAAPPIACDFDGCPETFTLIRALAMHKKENHANPVVTFKDRLGSFVIERGVDGQLHCLCNNYSVQTVRSMVNHAKSCKGPPPLVKKEKKRQKQVTKEDDVIVIRSDSVEPPEEENSATLAMTDEEEVPLTKKKSVLIPGTQPLTDLISSMMNYRALSLHHKDMLLDTCKLFLENSDLHYCIVHLRDGVVRMFVPEEYNADFRDWLQPELRRCFPELTF